MQRHRLSCRNKLTLHHHNTSSTSQNSHAGISASTDTKNSLSNLHTPGFPFDCILIMTEGRQSQLSVKKLLTSLTLLINMKRTKTLLHWVVLRLIPNNFKIFFLSLYNNICKILAFVKPYVWYLHIESPFTWSHPHHWATNGVSVSKNWGEKKKGKKGPVHFIQK